MTTNGTLLVTQLVVFAASASSLVIRLADMIDSLIGLFLYPRSRRILWRSLALFSKCSFFEQMRRRRNAWLYGMDVFVWRGWQLVQLRYWCVSVGLL